MGSFKGLRYRDSLEGFRNTGASKLRTGFWYIVTQLDRDCKRMNDITWAVFRVFSASRLKVSELPGLRFRAFSSVLRFRA